MAKRITGIKIEIQFDGMKSITGKIDGEESFIVDLYAAISNGKDPIDAIALLADIGSRNLKTNPIAVKNRIG